MEEIMTTPKGSAIAKFIRNKKQDSEDTEE